MADLSNLATAIDALAEDATNVETKVDELLAEIATLTAGQISQEQIDALTDKANAVDASLDALSAAAPAPEPAP